VKTATVQELRYQFAKISRWIDAGEKVRITKQGTLWARVIPLPKPQKVRKRN
jgi:antitoxin (DNA-binding transcriptional repressor) of toxin-antitoxin stability system